LCAYLAPEHIVMADVPAFGRRPRFSEGAENSKTSQVTFDVCPGVELSRTPEMLQRQGVIQSLAKEWGPILEIWEGYAADPEIRFKGSSGGVMSAISLYCLECEGMHGVLHTKADAGKPYLNKTVMSQGRNSILVATGSRYSPASPCEGLQEIEKAPVPCVFNGKPCDVAALQKVRRRRSAIEAKVGLAMACFCAGTPSTNGTLEMLRHMGFHTPSDLADLRYRGCGWPGKTIAKVKNNNHKNILALSYEQSWGDILQKYRQWRCYICPDHTGEFADIAMGDPWYKDTGKDELGRSLVWLRTELGREIFNKALSAGYVTAQKVDWSSLPASQGHLLNVRSMLWGRLLALRLLGVPCPSYKSFSLSSSWNNRLSLTQKVNTFLRTLKRIYKKKLKLKQVMQFDIEMK
jgi:coenzyme F420 hydrogenase subunit beta